MLTREDVQERLAIQNVGDTERFVRTGVGAALLLAAPDGVARVVVFVLVTVLSDIGGYVFGTLGRLPALSRQAPRLGAEEQVIPFPVRHVRIAHGSPGAEGKQPPRRRTHGSLAQSIATRLRRANQLRRDRA